MFGLLMWQWLFSMGRWDIALKMIVHQRVYKNRGLERKAFGNKEVGELILPLQPYHGVLIYTRYCGLWQVHREGSAQDLPPAELRMELLTEWNKVVQGKGLKKPPVPVVGSGKHPADESERMSSWLRQINAAQGTVFLSLPQPQTTLWGATSHPLELCTR